MAQRREMRDQAAVLPEEEMDAGVPEAGADGEKKYEFQEAVIRLKEGTRLYSAEPLNTPERAIEVMRDELATYDREVLVIVNLNTRLQAVNYQVRSPDLKPMNFNIVSVGNLNTSLADISNILKSCILSNSMGYLLLHNHPSSDPTPSQEDIELTKRAVMAGRIIGIPCLDHIIVGANRKEYFSMRENETVNFNMGVDEAMREAESFVAEPQAAYQTGYSPAAEGGYMPGPEQPSQGPVHTPFGDIDPEAFADSFDGKSAPREPIEEVALHFAKGNCSYFKAKDGREMASIMIPGEPGQPWPRFVLPANKVHTNRYGKGLWAKVPADGTTTLSITTRTPGPDGKMQYHRDTYKVTNRELKEMVESYIDKSDRGGDRGAMVGERPQLPEQNKPKRR